ncbi:MAG TPA: 2Fe-2S iron-sulfur cluster binding domain-containing protein [Cellvibrionaceae bacterium]
MVEVEFNQQLYELEDGANLLTALEQQGVKLPNSCRAGVCQACLVQVIEGAIPHRAQEGLTTHQKAQGLAMACVCSLTGALRAQTPQEPAERFVSEILQRRWLKGDIVQLCINKPFEYQAGQYARLFSHPTNPGAPTELGRCYSMASLPDETHLEFHIRVIPSGLMSTHLAQLPLGAKLLVQGPMGNCFYQARSLDQPLLLAAIGTGMAPILGVARSALRAGHRGPIYCVMGAKEETGLYPLPGLHQVAAAPNVSLFYIVQQAGTYSDTYEIGDIYAKIRTLVPSMKGMQAYVCGAPSFVKKLKKQCFLAGANLKDIFSDAFLPS